MQQGRRQLQQQRPGPPPPSAPRRAWTRRPGPWPCTRQVRAAPPCCGVAARCAASPAACRHRGTSCCPGPGPPNDPAVATCCRHRRRSLPLCVCAACPAPGAAARLPAARDQERRQEDRGRGAAAHARLCQAAGPQRQGQPGRQPVQHRQGGPPCRCASQPRLPPHGSAARAPAFWPRSPLPPTPLARLLARSCHGPRRCVGQLPKP
jgi:hypothetical protein